MRICREKTSKDVCICIEDGDDGRSHFILLDGRVELFSNTDFDAFVEQTDEMYLMEYLIITAKQFRTYLKYKEALINDVQQDQYV